MRTTLTLDDDVAARLKAETRRSGKSFKQVVNDYLRLGLHAKKSGRPSEPFVVEARDMGRLLPGLSLDDIGELLERIEGSAGR